VNRAEISVTGHQRQPWDSHSPYQWLACILITAGWILATTLIAGIIRELARKYREQFSHHEVQQLHPCSPITLPSSLIGVACGRGHLAT
jgi:hypothetical protein